MSRTCSPSQSPRARSCLKCALAQSGRRLTTARASARARARSPVAAAAAERLQSSTALLGATASASPYSRSASAHQARWFGLPQGGQPGSCQAGLETKRRLFGKQNSLCLPAYCLARKALLPALCSWLIKKLSACGSASQLTLASGIVAVSLQPRTLSAPMKDQLVCWSLTDCPHTQAERALCL